ncbi:MAG TPA: lipopolysaccharide biosynthesis protein [Candidatus Limnocylindrales bacterium]|nr:lipopolysaccharide biosynthesis protein [Candidatus Limnocylindrales bacterium]
MRLEAGFWSRQAGRWLPGGFGRSVALLASGTAVAQAISVAASPFLSRLYTPDAFGAFGVLVAIVSIGAVGVGLRYEAAIPLADGDDEALAVVVLVLLLVVLLSVGIGFAGWLALEAVGVEALGSPLRETLLLVPLALFLTGVYQTLTFWATRVEAFGASARAGVAQSTAQAVGQLALGVAGGGAMGLGTGYLVGRATGVGVLRGAIGPDARGRIRRLGLGDLRAAAGRHRRFPLIALWSSLLNSAGFQVPVLILAALFEAAVVGWFLLTVRVLQLPLAVIGSAVGQAFYARASRETRDELRSTTSSVFQALVILGTGPLVLLAIGGDEGFALVFGEAWREAGNYARWLAPWLLLVFVASPLSTMVYVLSRQRGELIFQLALVGVRVGALVAGWRLGAADVAIALFGGGSAVLWGIYVVWLLTISGAGVRVPLARLGRELVVAVVLILPIVAAGALGVRGFAWALVAAATLAVMVVRSARRLRTLAA